jgi:hypothetical protein
MAPDEYAFFLLWSAIEGAKDSPEAIVGGVGLLVVGAAVVLIKDAIRIAHEYLDTL